MKLIQSNEWLSFQNLVRGTLRKKDTTKSLSKVEENDLGALLAEAYYQALYSNSMNDKMLFWETTLNTMYSKIYLIVFARFPVQTDKYLKRICDELIQTELTELPSYQIDELEAFLLHKAEKLCRKWLVHSSS